MIGTWTVGSDRVVGHDGHVESTQLSSGTIVMNFSGRGIMTHVTHGCDTRR